MPSKAIVCAATALVLLISTGTFAQTQSSFTSTVGGTGSSSTSSSSSAIGISTSSEQQEQQQQQQQQLQEEGAGFQPQEQPQQPEAPAVSLSTDTRQVQPFSTIALCAPINLRILPNTTFSTPEDAYAFIISAEEEILSQIQSEVGPEGVLAITAAGPFTTNQTVQLTVSLPPDALHAIVHSGPNAAIYVAPGFNVSAPVNITTSFGAGEMYIQDLVAERLSIVHHGIDDLIVLGQFSDVTALSASISDLYISGVQNSVQLTLESISDAFIGQQPTSMITGTASGLNRVTYTAGSCLVTSPFSAFSNVALQTCTQEAFLSIPPAQPTWTCGLQVEGNFTCRDATVLALGPQGTSVSQAGTPTLSSTAPGGFFFSDQTAQGGTQVQAGQAQPGRASALAGIAGTGSVSSSASSLAGSGGSISTTHTTTQNGVTQGFTTTSGGQTQTFGTASGSPGVLVSYEGPGGETETATAASTVCAAPLEVTRMPLA